ncbi:hypothetical protein LSAT2_031203, partial [Lamellibrachia satsuma]
RDPVRTLDNSMTLWMIGGGIRGRVLLLLSLSADVTESLQLHRDLYRKTTRRSTFNSVIPMDVRSLCVCPRPSRC